MADEVKSLKPPGFAGDKKEFQTWWMRYKAYCQMRKVFDYMGLTQHPDLPTKEVADAANPHSKQQQAALSKNEQAMYYLTLAFQTEQLLGMIYKSQTPEYPNGLAWMVVKSLHEKYRPKDRISRVEMRRDLAAVKLGKKEDPARLFEELHRLQNMYMDKDAGIEISQDDLIAQAFSAAPEQYQAVMIGEQRFKGDQLTLDDLEQVMDQHWRATYGRAKTNTESSDGAKEIVMANTTVNATRTAQRRGGRQGGGNTGGNTKDVVCHLCKRKGHYARDCWMDPKNADKVPAWFKPRAGNAAKTKSVPSGKGGTEIGAAAASSGGKKGGKTPELLFCNVDVKQAQAFPKDIQLLLQNPDIYIADTATTVNIKNSKEGMENLVPAGKDVKTLCANGGYAQPEAFGEVPVMACDNRGKELGPMRLMEVALCPESPFNLIGIGAYLAKGWTLEGNEDMIVLTKGRLRVVFDIVIETEKGRIYAGCFKPRVKMRSNAQSQIAAANSDVADRRPITMNIQQAHQRLGHMSESATRKAAAQLGWTITRGGLGPCEPCTVAKAKQKNIAGTTDDSPATKEIPTAYLDQCIIKDSHTKQRVHWVWWILVWGRYAQLKFSRFFRTKKAMIEPTAELLHKMKLQDRAPKTIRMDNAGENKKLHQRMDSKDWKLGIKVEYTARNTPQQNSLAEVGFTTLTGRGRAMLDAANVPDYYRHVLIPEALKTATLLDGLVPVEINGVTKTRYEHFQGENPPFASHLRTWGEAGTVTLAQKKHPKEKNKGVICMNIGYCMEHAGDTYRMWDRKTGGVHETRDVTWLRRMYFSKEDAKVGEGKRKATIEAEEESDGEDDDSVPELLARQPNENDSDNEDSDDEDDGTSEDSDEEAEDEAEEQPEQFTAGEGQGPVLYTTRSGRSVQGRDLLGFGQQTELNYSAITLTQAEEKYYDTMEQFPEAFGQEISMVGAGIGGGFVNTQELHVMKYDEAMKQPDAAEWMDAVEEEHHKMVKSDVFEVTKLKDVPKGATILSSTWVMKKKASGAHRARVTARGFEQIDGEHYDENDKAAPVVCEATIRIMFILILMAGWWAEVIDVVGAFLLGEFDPKHKMYLWVPQGFERFYPDDVVLRLKRTLYGTKQAAMAFWKKLTKTQQEIGTLRSKADPCLHYRWTSDGLMAMISWVDDCLMAGPKGQVLVTKKDMMNIIECEEAGELNEYIGCKIDIDWVKRTMKLTQPVILQSLKDEFELPTKNYTTPAPAGDILTKAEGEDKLDPEKQFIYRSATGKLLHLMKWSRPEALNRVRELSRFMMEAGKKQFQAMQRVLGYMVSTPNRGLVLAPKRTWDGKDKSFKFIISGKSDSDYATNPETRHSVSGWSTFLEGAVVTTKSRMQKCVTLSVTEAELVAATECAQDMIFIKRVLESMELQVELPMVLEVDNKGAFDLANNWSAGGRTRHVATRVTFLRELKEEGTLIVKWISNEFMSSDIFTKNLGGKDFKKHATTYVGDDEYE